MSVWHEVKLRIDTSKIVFVFMQLVHSLLYYVVGPMLYKCNNVFSIFSFFQLLNPVDGTLASMEVSVFQIMLPIVSHAPVQPVTEEPDVN